MFKKISEKIKKMILGDENNAGIKWSLYGRVWREIGKPNWKWLFAGVICTILAASAEGFTITLVQKIVDKTFFEKNIQSIYVFGLQIVAAFGAKGIFSYAKSLTMAKAGLLAHAHLSTLSSTFSQILFTDARQTNRRSCRSGPAP